MKILRHKPLVILSFAIATLSGCGGDSAAPPSPSVVVPLPPPPTPPSGNVSISGVMTFDRVPNNAATNTLDYANIIRSPIRRHVVEAANSAGAIIATTSTDIAGRYSVTVPAGAPVSIRVRAQVLSIAGATYNIQIVDNTNANAPYVLAGSLVDSGTTNSTRDLNAASGWGGTSYTGSRAAAPFAVLDTVLEAVEDIVAVDASVAFRPLNILWSPNNRPATGTLANGEIETSFFSFTSGNEPFIALLGAADTDTDEYDSHVIVHEFGHYVEGTLSRSDSLGGSHSDNEALDSRVAFSEGFGNAFSGMILNDPRYRDSFGPRQAQGFSVNVEANGQSPAGWFNEGSVGSILYDIFDTNSDGADNISAGFGPIYRALRDSTYINNAFVTNIHSYLGTLAGQPGIAVTSLDALIAQQSIGSRRADIVGETNSGGLPFGLPYYKLATVGGAAVNVCSTNRFGTENKLGNYDFVRLSNAAARQVTVTVTARRGPNATTVDPLFTVYQRGAFVRTRDLSGGTSETETFSLPAGEFIIAVASFANIGQDTANTAGDDACYDFTVQ
jgi:hypothetical protein